jgi:hypothetical protein
MAISVQCDNCERNYNVSESHAGKKFRCKGCLSIVSVPAAASAPANDDPFDFDLSAMAAPDGSDYGNDWESGMPAPMKKKPVKKKRKPAPKAKTRARSTAGGSSVGKKIGAFLAAFCVVGWLVNIGIRVAQRVNPGVFAFATWSEYTTPGGEATFDIPGRVQSRPGGPMAAPGSTMYMGESRNFACGVLVEPKPIEIQGFSEDEALTLLEPGVPLMGGTNVRRTTVNGRPALAYDVSRDGFSGHCALVVGVNYVYSILFLYKDNYDAAAETRFLQSVRVNM